ncbi:hypothetical protein Cgig2_022364 [Carnegiea gigantea]|uniref:Uncharacterized protein n=1 Tax=Carnegiea gigantea TaxID=171969 RepID=A0A9Q1KE36_9CARY|nr:hypothetical protein Cgig2_022364 [Carnegiea gigantea]
MEWGIYSVVGSLNGEHVKVEHLLSEAMGMELRSRRNQTGRACKPDLEVEAKKRRRTVDEAISSGSNDGMREDIVCIVERDMWEDSIGSEYEAPSEDEGGSECEVSLEVESDVDGKMGDGDGGGILSCEGGEGRPSYSGGEGRSGGECKRRGGSSTAFRQGKDKGAIPVERDQGHGMVNRTGDSEVVLRSRCTLRTLVGLNGRMTVTQREAVKATVLWPFLEYPELGMERHLTLSLIKCWVPRWKAFRVGGRRVLFSVYDVALFTGLPATGRAIELNRDEMSTEVGDMVRERMNEWEREEMARVDHGGRYDANELLRDIEEQEVIPVLYRRDDKIVHPTIQDFMETDEFGYYVDDGEGWLSVDERLRRARDAYRSEKVAHESTKNELQMLREQVANLEGRLVTNRKGEEDGQDVSSGTVVGAEEGVGGDGGPTPGDISTTAGVMDAVRGVGQQPVSRNEGAVYGLPGGVDKMRRLVEI